jgi:5-hydroxyisourate hydrolase
MSAITTHVLDTVLGRPAAGVQVRLEKQEGGGWIEVTLGEGDWMERVQDITRAWSEVARGQTDADGRCRELKADAAAGIYRLVFQTGAYLRAMRRRSIYPEIAITFTCNGEEHYHLPLLLSDQSYTTYRGS